MDPERFTLTLTQRRLRGFLEEAFNRGRLSMVGAADADTRAFAAEVIDRLRGEQPRDPHQPFPSDSDTHRMAETEGLGAKPE